MQHCLWGAVMKQNRRVRHVILAAVDRSTARDAVIQAAASMATPRSEVHLVYVLADMTTRGLLEEATQNVKERREIEDARNFLDETVADARLHGVAALHGHLAAGSPAREILQTASDVQADAIVIGTNDYRGVRRLALGSVSEVVAKRAQCPVLVVRPKNYAEGVAEVEPACPDCLAVQASTNGASLWCEPHMHRRRHAHVYHAGQGAVYGEGSMFVK
jgi:nucleotide-binding universal stress UspA family protein